MRVRLVLAAVIAGHAAAASPQSKPLSTVPIPQSQVVRIDVLASDARGRTIDGLKVTDFEVRDDGVVQRLDAVRFVQARDQSRAIAMFLDEYHVSPAATARVREALTRFVEQELQPSDLLVVVKPLDSLLAIQLGDDRTAARAAIDTFEGRRGEYEPRNAYERNFMAGAPARIESARTQVAYSAINALAVRLGQYPDQRKTLIVVSEGMARLERRRGLEFLPTGDTIVRSAQKSNVAIYAIDPSGAANDTDPVRALANETVGEALGPDIDEGLRRALDAASAYYFLTYRTARPDDGRFHAVQVQIKRAGAQVRARKGYFAPSPDDALRAALLASLNAPKPAVPLEPAPHISTLIRPWFGTSRGADGKTRVTFVWEPVLRLTGERNRRVPSRVKLTALAADDSVLFEGLVNPTGPALIEEAGGVPSRISFDMPPGRLRLRMSILDAAQQSLDSDVRSLTIRDMRTGVVIGTPEILRARNAREFRTLDNDMAVPVAAREFSRTERLLIRFRAYGPDDSPVSVSARLLSRMGPMRDLAIESAPDGVHEIDLSLAGLASGEYLVEISAAGSGGDAKDVIDFRVTT